MATLHHTRTHRPHAPEPSYHACLSRIIRRALPEPDPARYALEGERLLYTCDAPQSDVDWIRTNAADDIQTLSRGLAVLSTLAAADPPDHADARALAEFTALLSDLIAQLSVLHERATFMTGKDD